MAVNIAPKAERRLSSDTVTYPGAPEPLKVPRTPLESRQGYHPKKDQLVWRTPPSRQLTREKRVEYSSDVQERFYDDYLGPRSTGDARNEVLTGVHKLGFNPDYYRANALQGMVYDPGRPMPSGVDLTSALRVERTKERQREMQQFRSRRLSDSFLLRRPSRELQTQLEPIQPQRQLTGPQAPQYDRPQFQLQQSIDETLNPDVVPAVEDWLKSASHKDQEVATKFFRTLSSHGKRPDPAAKAALHRTRVRSAVMTPSRKTREDRTAQGTFQQLTRETANIELGRQPPRQQKQPLRRRHSSTEKGVAKGGMFAAAVKQQPSHFMVHPDWASESADPFRKKH